MATDTLEYSKEYSTNYKQKFHDNACEMFDSWIKDSKIDADENSKTAKEYRQTKEESENIGKQVSKYKGVRGFLIFLTIVSFFAAVISGFMLASSGSDGDAYASDNKVVPILILIAGIALGIVFIVLTVKIVNSKLKYSVSLQNEAEKKAKELYETCIKQLRPLYDKMRDSSTAELIQKTVPIIKMDPNFDVRRLDLLKNKYGLNEKLEEYESIIGVFSGEILGNPFVEQRRLQQTWGTQTYYGSLTIYWTETYYDSDGSVRTVQKSETLHADVEKPKPEYKTTTTLIYANEAAPNLEFARSPGHAERMSEKEREKFVKKFEKTLAKKEKEAIKKGETFTSLGNVEFEALFNATNRNDEVEYRLLFTPLAQKNMIELLTNEPFGDDFHFVKAKMLNAVVSEHSQNWDFDVKSSNFTHYDVEMCKESFVKYNDEYFKNLYFELAPLMSIPLYQQHKPHEYIYKDNYPRNYTLFETDVLANALDSSLLSDPSSITNSILKTQLICKNGEQDEILIRANSFYGTDMVDYVSVYGGDGKYHDVPVPWVQYNPISKSTAATIKKQQECNNEWNKSSAILHNLRIDLK